MPERTFPTWWPWVPGLAGAALCLLAGVGGVVAALAGVAAQPLLALATRSWHRRDVLASPAALRRDGLALLALWAATVTAIALLAAWPLSALLRSGALLPVLGVSAVAGLAVAALWRTWPLWQGLERDGGTPREHADALRDLDAGAWRGLALAAGITLVAALVLVLAWPGIVSGGAAWATAAALFAASVGVHVAMQRLEPAEALLVLDAHEDAALDLEDPLPAPGQVPAEPLEPALYAAARGGRVERALELLDAGADPNAAPPADDRDRRGLAVLAAVLPDLRLLRALIARGVDLNAGARRHDAAARRHARQLARPSGRGDDAAGQRRRPARGRCRRQHPAAPCRAQLRPRRGRAAARCRGRTRRAQRRRPDARWAWPARRATGVWRGSCWSAAPSPSPRAGSRRCWPPPAPRRTTPPASPLLLKQKARVDARRP